jgi:hypothetical protein
VVPGQTLVAQAAIPFTMKETLDHRWRITRYDLGITYAAVLATSDDRVYVSSSTGASLFSAATRRQVIRP